jgi:glycosyltransferase involved in cell wall biosynthesis
MKIAHIAPPWFPIPPKTYGGTENVLYHLIEEQVAQGHEVTLYAPGDSQTSAQLISFFSHSLRDSGVPWPAHLKSFYHLYKAVESVKTSRYDIVHLHLSSSADFYLFPLMADLDIPRVMTLHSRFPFDHLPDGWTGDADQLYMEWASSMPMVAISKHARAEVSYPLDFVGVVYHGLPLDQYTPVGKKQRDRFVWIGRCDPEKGPHLAIQAAKEAGVPLVLAGTVDRHLPKSVRYFQQQIKPHLDNQQVRYIGPVNMKEKINLLSRARGFLNPIE